MLIAIPYLFLWTRFFLPVRRKSESIRSEVNEKLKDKQNERLRCIIFFSTFTSILISTTQSAPCQNYIDLIKLNYNYTSLNAFNNSDIKTSIAEIDLEATLPIVINERVTFVTGLYGETFRVKLDVDDLSKNFYSISPKLGVNITHGEKWSGTYMLLPKLASDFEKISSEDFQMGGFVLMKYNHKPNLNYKFGVYANSEFFGPWIVPLFGLYYLSNSKKFEANLTLPFSADANYQLNTKTKIGINFTGITKSYRINEPVILDKPGYLARATTELFGYVSFNLTRNILVQAKGGRSLGRYYRVYDEDDQIKLGIPLLFLGDNRTQLNSDFTDGWVFQVMAIYRLQLDPEQ
ncbi:MAG TPA: DUF6268 family outer membrane beta-barrel protein [Chitinophagales bacterium]|nr:DUF6268 family outer membrane beta-barrel protein [Chitinophagales bacterium]